MEPTTIDVSYLAVGRFDSFWEISLQPWDYAAGNLLIEEAGGTFTDFEGNLYTLFAKGLIIASNGLLHDKMVKKI
ncbi:MAG: hypothetical protein P0S93_02745 [Candidatus Neptunochlamydia sp.]|nr:hypothetical protein [Candidatus Neptunochlamydia sp.]